MLVCDYCGKSEEEQPLVQKPDFFTYNGRYYRFIDFSGKKILVCLDCLTFEIKETKHE